MHTVPQLKGTIHNPHRSRIPDLQRQNLGFGSSLIELNANPDPVFFLLADPDPPPDPGLFCKLNFYHLDPDPATQINADPDSKPWPKYCPDLIWSMVLRYPFYGRNLQLSSRLDHRSSPEPPVI
jgi:hypothetical protein